MSAATCGTPAALLTVPHLASLMQATASVNYFPIYIDNNLFWIIISSIPVREGRFMRRLAVERGRRRLRAQGGCALRTREAGVAVRAHYGALPSMAGRGTGMGGKPYPPRPRKHGPRSEIAAVARRKALRGCGFVADGKADRVPATPAPFGALPPLVFRGETTAPPGLIELRECESLAV